MDGQVKAFLLIGGLFFALLCLAILLGGCSTDGRMKDVDEWFKYKNHQLETEPLR